MTDKMLEESDIDIDVDDKSETTGVSVPIEVPEVKPEESSRVKDKPEPKSTRKRAAKRKEKATAPKAPVVVQMQSQWPGRLIIDRTPSGKEYIFERAGAILGIDPQDVDYVLSKNRTIESHGVGCCGGGKERIYTRLV